MAQTAFDLADRMPEIQSLEEYEKLRGDLTQEIASSPSLMEPVKSGAIAMDEITLAVDALLAHDVPGWFEASCAAASKSTATFVDAAAVMDNLGGTIDSISKRQKLLQTALSEMDGGGISAETVKSMQDALAANERLTDYLSVQNGVLKINAEAWSSRTFGDIKNQIAQRREALREEIDKNLTAIENLKKLKGLDLTAVYGSASAGKSGGKSEKEQKEVEAYTATIDALYAAEHRLAQAQRARAEVEAQIGREENPAQRIAQRRQLIDAFNEEIAAEENLLKARQTLVGQSVDELRGLGFEVQYDAETNKLFIENMERINALTVESKGKYDSLQEATNELRRGTEQLIGDVESWNKANQDAAVSVNGLRDSVRKTKDDILADIAEMRRAAEDALKEVVGAFDALNKAGALSNFQNGNIGEAFFPSVSTFQSLMGMESKYLSFLNLENGTITINRAALKQLTAAKVEDLAVTQAMALVDTVAEHREDAETLRKMADATQQATGATWDLVYAKLAQQNLDADLNAAFLQQIDAMRQLSQRTQIGVYLGFDDASVQNLLSNLFQKIKGYVSDLLKQIKAFVDEFISALKQSYKNILDGQKSGLSDVPKLTMDLIKYEVEQKIEGLKQQIAAYKEIVDLKKQELDLARQQADYEDGLAGCVAEIARLRTEIAQLSLDDSREAFVLRIKKEEELAEKQKDLASYQDNHAYDSQVKALDDAAAAFEKQKQGEIESLESTISSQEKLYQLAIQRLETDFWRLYEQVIAWNSEAGSSVNSEITAAWQEAAKAVTLYMGYLNAVKAVDLQLKIKTEGIGAVIADALVDAFSGFFTKTYDFFAGFLNKFLGLIGVQLPTGQSVNPGTAALGVVGDVIGGAINGIVNGVKGFISGIFGNLPFFHSGGHVGGKVRGISSDPAEEVIAVLQSDEVVLTKQQQKTLLTQLDFLRELGTTCGGATRFAPMSASYSAHLLPDLQHTGVENISNYGNLTVSAPIEVFLQHSGALDDATAARFGKKIADTTAGAICEAFRKKGIHAGGGNGGLKG
jgi:hypothetical protein